MYSNEHLCAHGLSKSQKSTKAYFQTSPLQMNILVSGFAALQIDPHPGHLLVMACSGCAAHPVKVILSSK